MAENIFQQKQEQERERENGFWFLTLALLTGSRQHGLLS
jgi:hypothetical protein